MRGGLSPRAPRARGSLGGVAGARGAEGQGQGGGPVEPVPAPRRGARRPAHRRQPLKRRVCPFGGADGPFVDRKRGLQLQRARHGQHGGAAALRLRRAARALACAAAGRGDSLGVLHDRARGRLLGCDQHAGDRDARRRGGRGERAQVVEHRHRSPQLRGDRLHGLDRPRARTATTSIRWCSSHSSTPA